jgi:hypothetical protein
MLNPLNARLSTSIPASLRGIMECLSPQSPTLMRLFKQAIGKVESALRLSLVVSGLMVWLAAGTADAITFANDPNLGAVSPGSYLDGTVQVGGCSGALLSTGMHVITAAHCIGQGTTSGNVTFNTTTGSATISFSQVARTPGSSGNVGDGADLAIVTLDSLAPVSGYQIYRNQTLSGPTLIEVAGYGATGAGLASTAGTVLRAGTNTYDLIYDGIPGNPYIFDFDDGTPQRDTLGDIADVHNLGTGNTEAMLASGDSGGPSFIQIAGTWELAGIHSFIASPGLPLDVDNVRDSSFGELSGDTRLAFYAQWIDSVTGVPEPGSWALIVAGLIGIGTATRRSRRVREQSQ